MRLKSFIYYLNFIIFYFTFSSFSNLYSESDTKRILIINSYHQSSFWTDSIVQSIQKTISKNKKNIKLYIEYLDSKRNTPEKVFPFLKEYFSSKYKDFKSDVIIVSDNNALNFVLDNKQELFKNTPIVFCGINNFNQEMLNGYSDVTGVVEDIDLQGTIHLALTLFNKTKKILIVNDSTPTGKLNQEKYTKIMLCYEDKFDFEFIGEVSLDELLIKLKNLTDDTVVLLDSFFSDRLGKWFSIEEYISIVSKNSVRPVFSFWKYSMDHGEVLGGCLVDGSSQGQLAAQMSLDIINGKTVQELPILMKSPNPIFIDALVAKKFKINRYKFPEDTIFLNQKNSIYKIYWKEIVFTCLIILLLILIIFILLKNNLMIRNSKKKLTENENKFYNLFSSSSDGIIIMDGKDYKILDANKSFQEMHGYTRNELLNFNLLNISNVATTSEIGHKISEIENNNQNFISHHKKKDGTIFPIEISISSYEMEDRLFIYAFVRDLTEKVKNENEKKKVENQLRHSQKMDAVGKLAGGIAHDFNNMLTGIMGCSDLLSRRITNDEASKRYIEVILDASSQASELTQKLLAFSSKDNETAKVLFNVHDSIKKVIMMLKRSIDKKIEIIENLSASSMLIKGDASQIQNLFLNLGINARDAMPQGGILKISTKNIKIEPGETACGCDIENGEYIEISIQDTGMGMDQQTKERIFEPFFTTKEKGKGTGLGLSIVFQTIKDSGGCISVESKINEGTLITVYLPVITIDSKTVIESNNEDLINGSGCILVMDDEKTVEYIVSEMLDKLGFSVITADNGITGIKKYSENIDKIDLVILDMIMPKKNGKDTFYELQRINPDIKVLLASGFPENINITQLLSDGACGFIKKPYRLSDLSQHLKQCLNLQ